MVLPSPFHPINVSNSQCRVCQSATAGTESGIGARLLSSLVKNFASDCTSSCLRAQKYQSETISDGGREHVPETP